MERSAKRPTGPALVLRNVIRRKRIEAILQNAEGSTATNQTADEGSARGTPPASTVQRIMNVKREQCAYCPKPATTRDHIPPKCLFTPPLPALVTVPACKDCNNRASKDDGVFRNELSIMAGSFGESANAAERLRPTMRAIRRDRPTLARMVTGARLVERYTPGGIYLGHGYAVPLSPSVQERVIKRIVRGLYWHHFNNSLSAEIHVSLTFIDKRRPQWQDALLGFLTLRQVLIGDGLTFQYFCGQAVDGPAFSTWLLIFFRGRGEQLVVALTYRDHAGFP